MSDFKKLAFCDSVDHELGRIWVNLQETKPPGTSLRDYLNELASGDA